MRVALLFALLLSWPRTAAARAGGGDHFSSGSSGWSSGSSSWGSGSSGSSGWSSGSSSYSYGYRRGSGDLLGPMMEKHPWATLLVIAFLLYMVYSLQSSGTFSFEGPGLGARAPPLSAGAGVDRLREKDPDFSAEAFLGRVRPAFCRIQAAWSDGDMTRERHWLSDGVFERFQLLLELQRREGRLNKLSGVRVLSAIIVRAESDSAFDTIEVSLAASCTDVYVSASTGERLSGGGSEFTEVWSFLRSAGARSRVGPGLMEGNCPNCGGALSVNQGAVCPQCKAGVNSGAFDWVLAEITQESVWEPRREGLLDELRASDPALNSQSLEDRASVLFWRWQRCLADGRAAALEGASLPGALGASSGIGQSRYLDCAVGSVDVDQAASDGEGERVTLLVRWSGRLAGPDGRAEDAPALHATRLALVRRHGVLTPAGGGLRSAHCPGCGSPYPGPEQWTCGYCGRASADPAVDWVLESLSTT